MSATRRVIRLLALTLAFVVPAGCGLETLSSTPPSTSTPIASAEAPSLAPTTLPETTPPPTPVPPTAVPTPLPGGEEEYEVKAGDSLSGIARRFATSVAQLQAWNASRHPEIVTKPDDIKVGWILVVAGDPAITPVPAPTPRPTPRPSAPPEGMDCRVRDRVYAGGVHTYRRIDTARARVALTFDMGGRLDPGLDIVEFLIANKVCSTIFATGAMADTSDGKAILALVGAHPELFEVGNHTMHHCDLVAGGGGSPTSSPCLTDGRPSATFVRLELSDAAAIIRRASGQDPAPYWRPPYGSIDADVLSAAAAAGYTKTFLWDIDTIDWRPESDGGPSAAAISDKVVSGAQPGSIVLMHLGGYNTLDAIKAMVPALRANGLVPTSLSDLLQ